MGIYADDLDLRLREFSKSLTGKAYSWFVNLPANSIKTWEELVAAFCTKFFIAEHKLSIADLADEPQKESEPLAEYVTRFKERALDCKEIVPEASLINICVKGMQTKYRVFIENHVIQNFAELIIRVKSTEASVADMGSREVVQNKFQKWNNNRPPFPKRKRVINVVEARKQRLIHQFLWRRID